MTDERPSREEIERRLSEIAPGMWEYLHGSQHAGRDIRYLLDKLDHAERVVRGIFADYRQRACATPQICDDTICDEQRKRLALDEANILAALNQETQP